MRHPVLESTSTEEFEVTPPSSPKESHIPEVTIKEPEPVIETNTALVTNPSSPMQIMDR
jgi:hypothetical protein